MLAPALCWKLQSGNQVGYIFGTFHIKSAETYALTQSVYPYLEQCDMLCLEVDLDSARTGIQIHQLKTLRSIITPHLAKRWQPRLKSYYSLEIDQFLDLPAHMLYQAMTSSCFDSAVPTMVDEQLWEKAKSIGLPIRGLESIEKQLAILKLMEGSELLNMIKPSIRTVKKFRNSVLKMLKIYLHQDIRRLYQMGKRQAGVLRNTLIYQRNHLMVEGILQEFISGHAPFVAIGAGHLAGEQGVLRLLKGAGVKVRPISINTI